MKYNVWCKFRSRILLTVVFWIRSLSQAKSDNSYINICRNINTVKKGKEPLHKVN